MSDCCCGNAIETKALESRHRRALLMVLGINVVAFLVMVAGSWFSGSSALLSGTLDNLGDALTYAMSFLVVGAAAAAKAKVAVFKGCLILAAGVGVAFHIIWRLNHLEAPLADIMALAAALNLAANGVCFWILTPLRHDDINMASVWECSRNDLIDGVAVIATAGLVWWLQSPWPDVVVAAFLLLVFLRSAARVLGNAFAELNAPATAS